MRRCRLNVRQLAGAHRTLRVSRPVCGIAAYSKLRERSQHSSWSDLGWSRCFQSSDSVTDWSLHTPRVAARGTARAGPPASPGLTNHKCWLVGAGPGSMDLMTVRHGTFVPSCGSLAPGMLLLIAKVPGTAKRACKHQMSRVLCPATSLHGC